jgi:hypothetical protein
MFNRYLPLIFLGFSIFIFAACTATTPSSPTFTTFPTTPLPTLLPTAIPPQSVPGTWAVPFEYEFAPEFWSVGMHRYGYYIDCPVLGNNVAGEWQNFRVSEDVSRFVAPVFLRLGGLSYGRLGPISTDAIHPQQATIAVVTILGVSAEDAARMATTAECQVLMRWDDVATQLLIPGEPFQP